jgi:hypothetical protein
VVRAEARAPVGARVQAALELEGDLEAPAEAAEWGLVAAGPGSVAVGPGSVAEVPAALDLAAALEAVEVALEAKAAGQV